MKTLLLNLFTTKKKQVKPNNTTISSLAPKVLTKGKDIEKIQPYLERLKETIDTEWINNIALTGSYGSGKSTVIKTFKNLHPQYEYLNISLAAFNKKKNDENDTPADKKTQKEELERLLEVSILQQIFYHVKPTEIPESRFKRIINISNWKIRGISIGFMLWIYSTILLFKYGYLDKMNPDSWKLENGFDWFALFVILITFTGLGLFSKLVIKLFSNSKINKVNIKGELELGDNINKSVFNEHLEEILYFFERTKHNVVIIEDLDRFDSTDIFTKLREINILLNNSKLINREINFIYAVGDDLFEDKKERVKFFEYIIPVIPFINSSNADEQLRTLIKESGLDEDIFTKDFISDVVTFIDDIDMRLLINIFHEFVIYRKTLKPEFIKKNDELFAIITYKNLEPKDFVKLNSREGKLYELINNKKQYIENWVHNVDREIKQKRLRIKQIENQSITDRNELRSIYVNKILTKLPADSILNQSITELIDEKTFNKVIDNESIGYSIFKTDGYYGGRYNKSSNKNLEFSFSEIEKEVNTDYTYKRREELITLKSNNGINRLQHEIENLKADKLEIENRDLKQIFNEIDVNQYLDSFSNNKLLRNLIINGYINENYNDYISLFHEVSITKEDFTFERNVKSGYNTEYSFKLYKIENLVEKIDQKYFERETILNFDLLDYLGNNYTKYSAKYDSIIRLLSNDKIKSVQFIDEYTKNEDRPLGVFIEKLTKNWEQFWEYVYFNVEYTEEKRNKYLELIIRFANLESILNYQNDSLIKEAIEYDENFLSLINTSEKENLNKVKSIFKELKIKFEKLNNPTVETEKLFDYIYENNNYRITQDNLFQFIKNYDTDDALNNFNTSNYSTIILSKCQPLIDYVKSNINTYVEDVYLKLEDNNHENQVSLAELLNNEDLDLEWKVEVIKKTETKIPDLTRIKEVEIKSQLLTNNKVLPTWGNVIDYYTNCENSINEDLVNFLNYKNVHTELSKQKLNEESENFEQSMLMCNDISDDVYTKLINSCKFQWNRLNIENLSEGKIIGLVDIILTTTVSNYESLREHFPNNHITLIEKDFSKFIKNINDFVTDEEDVLLLLKSDKIDIDQKFNYASKLSGEEIHGSAETSKIVSNIVLLKSAIIEFHFDTFSSVVKNSTSIENKIKLVNLYFDKYSNNELVDVIKNVGGVYTDIFKKQHKPTFNNTVYNRDLFNKLKSKKLIKNFDIDKKDTSRLRVIANY